MIHRAIHAYRKCWEMPIECTKVEETTLIYGTQCRMNIWHTLPSWQIKVSRLLGFEIWGSGPEVHFLVSRSNTLESGDNNLFCSILIHWSYTLDVDLLHIIGKNGQWSLCLSGLYTRPTRLIKLCKQCLGYLNLNPNHIYDRKVAFLRTQGFHKYSTLSHNVCSSV